MNPTPPPALSVVIAIVSDTTDRPHTRHLLGCLEAVTRQTDPTTVELVVPYTEEEETEGIDDVRAQFPDVTLVPVTGLVCGTFGSREHHDVLRARGLLAARGELLALLEDHARPADDFCASVIAAHEGRRAAIGGAIDNDVDRLLNWAVYFCDFGRYQNPVPAGPTWFASDANVSYPRAMLFAITPTWQDSFREVIVNGTLRSQGRDIILDPTIVVYQHRQGLGLGAALAERFVWGRSYAGTRNSELSVGTRVLRALMTPILPVVLVAWATRTALARRRRLAPFLRSLPLFAVLQLSWSVGEGIGYILGVPRATAER